MSASTAKRYSKQLGIIVGVTRTKQIAIPANIGGISFT
jgi:hypothetical protein